MYIFGVGCFSCELGEELLWQCTSCTRLFTSTAPTTYPLGGFTIIWWPKTRWLSLPSSLAQNISDAKWKCSVYAFLNNIGSFVTSCLQSLSTQQLRSSTCQWYVSLFKSWYRFLLCCLGYYHSTRRFVACWNHIFAAKIWWPSYPSQEIQGAGIIRKSASSWLLSGLIMYCCRFLWVFNMNLVI